MTRDIGSGVAAVLEGAHVPGFPLVEMALDAGTLYLCGAAHDVEYAGHTYLATNGLGSVEPIKETDTEIAGLAFTLEGVFPAAISAMLSSEVQGRPVVVRWAFLDGSGALQVDTNVWTGYLDQMTLEDGQPNAVVRVTAEHRLITWATPKVVRFSNEDHQALHPGDAFFEFAAQLSETTLIWPGKEFGRQ